MPPAEVIPAPAEKMTTPRVQIDPIQRRRLSECFVGIDPDHTRDVDQLNRRTTAVTNPVFGSRNTHSMTKVVIADSI